jgi:hypothetical protein
MDSPFPDLNFEQYGIRSIRPHPHTKAHSKPAQLSANFNYINLNVQFIKPNRLDGRSSLIESAQQLTKE